jgi:WbqC-like protein family.
LHWTTLQTAYRSSAYFEYYEDELAPFYQQRYERLFEYNMALLQLMLRLLKIERPVGFTESYLAEYAPGMDYRRSLHPKKPSPVGDGPQYYQVFESKHGFIPNLSIVDLLFNHGPQSTSYL